MTSLPVGGLYRPKVRPWSAKEKCKDKDDIDIEQASDSLLAIIGSAAGLIVAEQFLEWHPEILVMAMSSLPLGGFCSS